MRFIYLLLFLVFITLTSCKSKTDPNWKTVKTSNDWRAYALFAQHNPESIYLEEAIKTSIKLFDITSGCFRFNKTIATYKNDTILYDEELTSLDSLSSLSYKYLHKGLSKERPHQRNISILNDSKRVKISKGYFEITIPNLFERSNTQKVLQELNKGLVNYKYFLAKDWFNKSFENLSVKEKESIEEAIGLRVLFFKNN